MYKKEFKEEEGNNANVKSEINEDTFSFTVNYIYTDSDLNLNKAFDLLFEEVIKELRNQSVG